MNSQQIALALRSLNQKPIQLHRLIRDRSPTKRLFHAFPSRIAKLPAARGVRQMLRNARRQRCAIV
jgi:hypothetical protein